MYSFGPIHPTTNRLVDERPCIQQAFESENTHSVLLATSVALLIIGLLATLNAFDCIGTTNALYLSYGAYAGAACLFIAEMIKIATKSRFEPIKLQELVNDRDVNAVVKKIVISNMDEQGICRAKIFFTNSQSIETTLRGQRGYRFLNAIDDEKFNLSRELINQHFGDQLTDREEIDQILAPSAEVLYNILIYGE